MTDAIATPDQDGTKSAVRPPEKGGTSIWYRVTPVSYYKAFIDFAISDQRHGYIIRQHIQKQLREF